MDHAEEVHGNHRISYNAPVRDTLLQDHDRIN
jgi:hypothetical protein